jgi:hypothetical protein
MTTADKITNTVSNWMVDGCRGNLRARITEIIEESKNTEEPDYQKRVKDEKRELDIKIVGLRAFLLSLGNRTICSEAERLRLGVQLDIMKTYSYILGERIEAFDAAIPKKHD